MNNKLVLTISSLLLLSSMAIGAETSPSKSKASQATCCMVANGCVQHTSRNLKTIDNTVSAVDSARTSNDPKAMHDALELAYKSLNEIKQDEAKNERAMKALYNHLTRVEEKAAKVKQEQSALNSLLDGQGLDAEFIID